MDKCPFGKGVELNTEPVPSAVPTPAEVEGLLSQSMAGAPGTTFTYRGKVWERGRYPTGLRAELARQGQSVWWIWATDASGQRTHYLVRIVDGVRTDLEEAA